MKQTLAYLYKWTDISTGKWYIGARYASGCYPDDGYICSSKIVKPMILENADNWQRTILCIGNPTDIVKLETNYLTVLNAKSDPMSYNKHNGDGKFSSLGKPSALKGRVGNRKGHVTTDEHKAKISASRKGQPAHNKGTPSVRKGLPAARDWKAQPEEANQKRSAALKGIPKSAEHNAKVSAALTGPRPKVVCRLSDHKEMNLAHFNRYCK